jgi:hypothetical protein
MFASALNSPSHPPSLLRPRVARRFIPVVSGARFFAPEGAPMNRSILISALLSTLSLAACEKPTVVNVPATPAATPAAVPGPAGPQGATGSQGTAGSAGETGKTGDTTVIVVPPAASAPTN